MKYFDIPITMFVFHCSKWFQKFYFYLSYTHQFDIIKSKDYFGVSTTHPNENNNYL